MFDPDADKPTPLSMDKFNDVVADPAATAEDAGVDPAHFLAMRDVGYIVIEMNEHMFSAAEIDAYWAAYERHAAD